MERFNTSTIFGLRERIESADREERARRQERDLEKERSNNIRKKGSKILYEFAMQLKEEEYFKEYLKYVNEVSIGYASVMFKSGEFITFKPTEVLCLENNSKTYVLVENQTSLERNIQFLTELMGNNDVGIDDIIHALNEAIKITDERKKYAIIVVAGGLKNHILLGRGHNYDRIEYHIKTKQYLVYHPAGSVGWQDTPK